MAAINPLSFCSASQLNSLTPESYPSTSRGGLKGSLGCLRGFTLTPLQSVPESEYPMGPHFAAVAKINPRKEGYLHSFVLDLSTSGDKFSVIQPYDLYEELGLPLSGGTSWLLQPSRPKSTAVKDNLVFFPNNWEAWSALLHSALGISMDVFSPKQNSGDHSMAKGDGDVRRPPLFEDWLAIASLPGMEPLYAADNGIVCVILHSNHQSSALARANPVFYTPSRVLCGSLIGSGYASCGVISLHSNHRNSTVNPIFYTPPKTMPSSSLGCPCWGLKPSPTVSVVGIDPRNAKAGRACSVVRATPTAGGGGVAPKNNIFAVISAIARFLPAFWKLVDDKLNISTSEQVLQACYFLVIVNQNPSSQLCTILHVLAMVTFIILAMGAMAILVHVYYKRRCSQVSDSDRREDGNAHSANNVYNDFQNGSIKTETFINNYHDATGRTATD